MTQVDVDQHIPIDEEGGRFMQIQTVTDSCKFSNFKFLIPNYNRNSQISNSNRNSKFSNYNRNSKFSNFLIQTGTQKFLIPNSNRNSNSNS